MSGEQRKEGRREGRGEANDKYREQEGAQGGHWRTVYWPYRQREVLINRMWPNASRERGASHLQMIGCYLHRNEAMPLLFLLPRSVAGASIHTGSSRSQTPSTRIQSSIYIQYRYIKLRNSYLDLLTHISLFLHHQSQG